MDLFQNFVTSPFEFFNIGGLVVHAVGFVLWSSVSKSEIPVKSSGRAVALSELILFLVWYFGFLYGLNAVLVAYIWVRIFEHWTGKRPTITNGASFTSKDNEKAKLPAFLALVNDSHEHNNKTYYNTDLQYAEYKPFFWGKATKYAVNLDDIQSLEEGVQPDLVRSLQQPTERTFHLMIGDNTTITYIADTEERRDKWIEAFHTLVNRKIDKYKERWLDWVMAQRTSKVAGTENAGNDLGITMTTVLEILTQANRPLDKAYAKDIFNTFAKISSSQPVNGEATLDRDRFHMFFDFVAKRPDVQQIYDRLLYKKRGEVSVSPQRLKTFLTEEQRENPSLETCKEWIRSYERIIPKHNLSALGFTSLLLSEEHSICNREHKKIYQDMHRPLSHYFIACSHNTYLMKDQLKGASSVEAYINAFKRGCKCVELDCWDGVNNEPIIYHGHTLTSKILFRDVITAVRDYGFTVSKYPVILSFENHCSVEQQKVMANHLVNILGPKLYMKSIPDNETELPSPEDLSGYVLVKGKKLKVGQPEEDAALDEISSDEELDEDELNTSGRRSSSPNVRRGSSPSLPAATNPSFPSPVLEEKGEEGNNNNGDVVKENGISGDRKDSVNGTDSVSESKEILEDSTAEGYGTEGKRKMSTLSRLKQKITKDGSDSTKSAKKKRPKVPKIAQELSDLVMYCQAVHFGGWQHAKDKQSHTEMSSFGEKKAVQFAKEQGRQFVEFTRRQLARIYPAGTRIDSSNYDPVALWNAGCQLVALNYQTAGRSMLLNQALFMNNGGCGYVLKPSFLTADNSAFDPKGPFDAKQCKFILIHVMSGHQLPYTNEKQLKAERRLYVQIKLSGVEQDEQKEKTKAVKNNGYNPVWNEVVGFKVHVPGLAFLSFIVYDADQVLAQYTLPFQSVMQGYRHVPLTNRNSEPLPTSSLFVKIEFKESS